MICSTFLRAARTDCRTHDTIILGRSRLPQGFDALQNPPLCYSPYVAARIMHALIRHAPLEPDAELARRLIEYGQLGDISTTDDCRMRLRRILVRAGVPSDHVAGAVLLLLWTVHIEKACTYVIPKPVYPALLHTIESEVRHVRQAERTRLSKQYQ